VGFAMAGNSLWVIDILLFVQIDSFKIDSFKIEWAISKKKYKFIPLKSSVC